MKANSAKSDGFRRAFGLLGRAFLGVACAWLFVCMSALGSYGASSVGVKRVTEGGIHPGDTVEVEIVVLSDAYRRFDLREPSHPGLSLISVQSFPVELRKDSGYVRKWTLVYQAMYSGLFDLAGGSVEYVESGEVQQLAMEPLPLTVAPFGFELDHNEAELPIVLEETVQPSSGWWLVIAVSAVAMLLFWLIRKRPARLNPEAEAAEAPTLAADYLRGEMARGRLPKAELESFLARFRKNCSAALVEAIERAVYSEFGSASELERLLGREFSR